MDAKLKDALSAKDYYSAHQLYLAISQRHCRSKRFEEAKKVLREGCVELSAAREHRSTLDLAKHFFETLSLGRLPLIDTDAVAVHSVLLAVYKSGSSEEVTEEMRGLAEMVLKEHPSLLLIFFHALLQIGAYKEAGTVLLKGEDVEDEWRLLGATVNDSHVVLSLTLAGLKARNFAAISSFLSALISSHHPTAPSPDLSLASGTIDEHLPKFITVISVGELSGEADTMARCLNLCQLLFVIFQHRLLPTSPSLNKTLQHYAGLIAKLRVREDDVRAIETSYLMQQQAESGAAGLGGGPRPDILANLFQSMMTQGAPMRRK